jgi:hypothetical protein
MSIHRSSSMRTFLVILPVLVGALVTTAPALAQRQVPKIGTICPEPIRKVVRSGCLN